MKRSLLAILLALSVIFAGMTPKAGAMAVNAGTTAVSDTTEEAGSEKENQNNGQFLVKINYGIDSLVSYDANTPVQVTITNQGEDFTGELVLTVVREYAKNYGYSNDISIPAGTTKTTFLTIPSNSNFNNCVVSILDEDGETVYERTIMNAVTFNSEKIIGVLSDDYAALNYLDGMLVQFVKLYNNSYDFRIGQMTEETMPDIASALGTCKIIVIDNFDTSKLSDAQYQALRQWVENGGLLLIGTGAEYNKTLSKFKDDFISGSIGSLGKKQVPMNGALSVEYVVPTEGDAGSGEWSDNTNNATVGEENVQDTTENVQDTEGVTEEEKELEVPVYGTEETLNLDVLDLSLDGGTPVADVAGGELFVEKQVGVGKVVVCKTALSMEPFASYDSNVNVIAGMLNAVVTTDIENVFTGSTNDFDTSYLGSYVIDGANGATLPKAGRYMVLFIIYILLVGPGIYLALKWKDKSKVLWVAIPVVAVIFTAAVYVVSINDTVRHPILTSYSVEHYEDASKTTITGFSVVNPKSAAYEVNLNNKYTDVRPLDNDMYYSGMMNQSGATCVIKETVDHTVLKFNKAQAFTGMYMQARATEATEQNIDLDLKGYRSGFAGTVTNNLSCDLVNAVVYMGGYASYFERIAAGETVEIKMDSSQKAISDSYQITDTFLAADAYSKDRKTYNRMNYMTNMLSSEFYQLGAGEGFIAGYEDGADADVAADKNVVEYSEIVAYKKFNVKYADVKGDYSINIHKDYLESSTYDWDTQYGYMWDTAEIEADYNFGDDGINTLYYIGTSAIYSGYTEAECYIWNTVTLDWDRIFADKDEEVNLAPYFFGEDGKTIRLRFVPVGSSYDSNMIPTIAGGEN